MGDVAPVLAITGTRREAAVLRHAGVEVLAIGGVEDRFGHYRRPLGAVISFGMAGALSPDLRIGDWVIGSKTCGALSVECDARWQTALARVLPDARTGPIYADGRLIGNLREKAALAGRHGALAADMESHYAARLAAEAGVPFAILRCISDEARHALPPAIAVAMRPDGGLDMGNILKSIMRNPGQLTEIMQTLVHFNRAYGALRRGASAIPARLAFDLR
ncbi:MAG: phosphorylase [Novosphingobium sp.]